MIRKQQHLTTLATPAASSLPQNIFVLDRSLWLNSNNINIVLNLSTYNCGQWNPYTTPLGRNYK